MRVLAIDPGLKESGLVVLSSKIDSHLISPNENILKINQGNYIPGIDVVAIEMVASYGMAVGVDVFETVVWIGRFEQHFLSLGYNVKRYTRREVKMYLCQSVQASDSNVRQAVIDRLGPPGLAKAPGFTYGIVKHEWAALAVALYAKDKLHYTKLV